MIRTKHPGRRPRSPSSTCQLDRLADEVADGTLAHHHPPGHPVPLRPQGRPAIADRRRSTGPTSRPSAPAATWSATSSAARRRSPTVATTSSWPRPQTLTRRASAPDRGLLGAVDRRRTGGDGRDPEPGRSPTPPGLTEPSRSTAPPTCPASSRSASPGRATTASTSYTHDLGAVPAAGPDGAPRVRRLRRRRAGSEPRRRGHLPPAGRPLRLDPGGGAGRRGRGGRRASTATSATARTATGPGSSTSSTSTASTGSGRGGSPARGRASDPPVPIDPWQAATTIWAGTSRATAGSSSGVPVANGRIRDGEHQRQRERPPRRHRPLPAGCPLHRPAGRAAHRHRRRRPGRGRRHLPPARRRRWPTT